MRSLPKDQTLIFPVGSVFPNATHFAASWKQAGETEPRGGMSLDFKSAPPLQIREHAKLPDGDYIVTIDIGEATTSPVSAPAAGPIPARSETSGPLEGLQTNIEWRVNLRGGETMILLAVDR